MGTIAFDPQVTSAPQSSFLLETEGYVQGAFRDDPTARMYLSSGVIKSTVTQPMWGGMAIEELVPTTNTLGSVLDIAAAYANVTGFSTFNQGYNGIITPGNNVPQYTAGMTLMYFRMGSNARIAVQCDATLAGNLDGSSITQQVSWDFTNQKLIAFNTTALPVKVLSVNTNSKIVSYDSGTGAVTWTTGAVAIIQL